MRFVLERDEFGRLIGTLSDGRAEATVTASDVPAAVGDLLVALHDAELDGRGECFWEEGGGEYRWMFARHGDKVRLAVLWCAGTLTGWEHVFWTERPFDELAATLRGEIGRLGVAA
jgi:hypothetical protein